MFVGEFLRRDGEGARRAGMGFIWIAPEDVQRRSRSVCRASVLFSPR